MAMILGQEEKAVYNQTFGDAEFDLSGINGSSNGMMVSPSGGMVQQNGSPGLPIDYNSHPQMGISGHPQQGMNSSHPNMYNTSTTLSQLAGMNPKGCTMNGGHPQQPPPPQQSPGMAEFMNNQPISPTFPPQTMDIPDIACDPFGQQLSQSPYSDGMSTGYPSPYQQQPSYQQNIMFSQALQQQHHVSMMQQNSVGGVAAHGMMSPHMASGAPGMNGMNQMKVESMGLHPGQVMARTQTSPVRSNTTSPGRESSEESDDSLPKLGMKRGADQMSTMTMSMGMAGGINQQLVARHIALTSANNASMANNTNPQPPKKQKTPKKRKKKDPNEPQKPVSAYALFFRDTQAAIKGQHPNASFGEVSKIVASMWDSLEVDHKHSYKKRTECAKKEYLKKLAAYRASIVSKQTVCDSSTLDPYATSPPLQTNGPQGNLNTTSPNGPQNPSTGTPGTVEKVTTSGISPPRQMYSPPQYPNPSSSPSTRTNMSSPSMQQYTSTSGQGPQHHMPGGPSPQGPQHHMSGGPSPQGPQHHMQGAPTSGPSPPGMTLGPMSSMAPPLGHSMPGAMVTSSVSPTTGATGQNVQNVPMINGQPIHCGPQGGHPMYNGSGPTIPGQHGGLSSPPGSHTVTGPCPTGPCPPSGSHRMCLRPGCHNSTVENTTWDNRFCSAECVAMQCR